MKTHFSKRMISLLLAVLTLFGVFTISASAAPTLEEAMAEVDVYAKHDTLNWLTMNGAVQSMNYTYYNYDSVVDGSSKEIPAYCVDPQLYGVAKKTEESTPIKYGGEYVLEDKKLAQIVQNGYPHQELSRFGLSTKEEGYYATKMAIWIHIRSGWSVNGLGINPSLSGADRNTAEVILQAVKDIYWRGMNWDTNFQARFTATPEQDSAYPITVGGASYYQQDFTIKSDTWVKNEVVEVSLEGAPAGTQLLDESGSPVSTLIMTQGPDSLHYGRVSVRYPADAVDETTTAKINIKGAGAQCVIYYSKSLQTDQYGNTQDYLLDTDPFYPVEISAISTITPIDDGGGGGGGDDDGGDGGLRITKLETGTETPLEGAVFEVKGPNGDVIGSFSTNASGVIEIPGLTPGNHTVTELTPPRYHLLPERTTQTVTVEEGKTAELTFWNDPYGDLRVEKVSDTGEKLTGVTIQIKNIVTGETQSGQTGPGGVIEFTKLAPGGYEVKETAGITGWIADTNTVQTVAVVSGETSTVTFTNKEAPGLRIIKYDRVSHERMAGVTFAVYRDNVFLGNFTTDQQGEVLIPNAQPGTYRAYEVDTGDDGHVLDTTPQEVELKAGDGIKELVFFNDMKPGLHLIKVDSADLSKPIANARFSIEAVDGSYGPEEFTTDQNGEIDLSKLPANKAYVVTELECPGYVIDEAQRIIQLTENETAHFVFTNSKKPDLHLKKLSSDGTALAGVSFRLAKIEDGSHYLDRTTDMNGEILWEGLEPGVYSLVETATVNDHILDLREHHVELFPGKTSTIVLENDRRPNLTIVKRDADTGEVVPGTVFEVRFADGHSVQDVTTGPNGKGYLENLLPGVYEISEKSVPEPYLQDAASQLVTLYPNRDREVLFENHKRPSIEIIKENSITHERQAHVPFQVWYASNNTSTGEYNDLGVYYTDENGRILLTEPDIYLRDGWFRVKELEPPHGFALADPDTQEAFIPSGTSHTFVFQNRPLSAICVWKYDSVSPNMAIEGAVFQIRYLSGNTSGTGGTVIGTYRTGKNGSFTATGLKAGTYIIEELSSDGDHVIDTPPQTVYLSGDDQEVIQVYFGNSPKGSLLVKKIDSVTRQPLSDVEFLVTDSKGAVVGDANGKFVTDSTGSFTVSGIDPGTTLIVKEVRSRSGYLLDDVPQTVTISAGQTVTLEFRNQPMGSLLIRKVCAVNPSTTLQDAEFKVTYADGSVVGDSNGVYRSDENGEVRIENLIPGKSVVVTETQAPPGYLIDSQSQTIVIQAGKMVTITMKNQPMGSLIIQKRDSQTNEVLPGAEFRIVTAAGCEVGLDGVIGSSTLTSNGIFTTDSQGEIRISNLAPGAYVISEIKAPDGGYVIDTPSTNVVIGTNGDTQTVVIKNTRKGNLIIEKYDSVTRQPLAGARFKVTNANGELTPDNEGLTSSNGIYTTDQNGQIILSKLLPDTYIVSEERSPDNYQADPTPQTVVVNAGDTQTVRFYNDPLCTLTILKRDAVTKKPLAGAEFWVRDGEGRAIGPNNGLYTTGSDGTVTVSGMAPNSTIICSEVKAPSGYVLDETPKTIVVRSGVANSLIFDDQPGTTLVIRKYISGTDYEPLAGVCFKVTDGSGAAVGPDDGVYYTDHAGEIVLNGIEPGTTVIAREIATVEGYVIDGTPQDILIKGGEVQRLTFWNKRAGTLVIQKKDSVSGALIPGAQFQLSYANGGYVDDDNGHLSSNGLYTTNAQGEIRISGITGTVVCKEVQPAPGYVIDSSTQTQTVVVNPEDTQTLVFLNDPLCSLTLTKLDSVTGKPVPNTEFTVTNGNGNVVGRYVTGADGTVVVTGLIPGATYTVFESRVPDGYVLDPTPQTITVTNGSGNSWTSGGGSSGNGSSGDNGLTFTDDPKVTLTVHKYIEGSANEPLAGVAFKLVDGSGAAVGPGDGVFYTNAEGEIVVEGLEPGTTVTAREVKTVEGFVLDGTPKTVKITAGSKAPELVFWNKRAGELVIRKLDSVTKEPLAGVEFELTYADGGYVDDANGHLSSNGRYITNDAGEIRISGIVGTVVAKEVKSLPNYTINEATRIQTVVVRPEDTQTLTFYNDPIVTQTLTIQKFVAGTTDPIQGVTFLVTDSSGAVVGPNNGEYVTDQYGRIVITDLTPGVTITAKEVRTVSEFVLDTTPQSILIKEGEAQSLIFFNKAEGGLELIKVSESDKTQRIPNTTFEIRRMDGGLVETVTTGENGRVHVKLDAGDYYTVEIEAAQGFKRDDTPHYFTVQDGKITTVTISNKPFSGILIHKIDSTTKKGIYGVTFLLYDSTMTPIGQYTSDDQGFVYIENLTTSGRYYLREMENQGYLVDTQYKTVYVKAGETTLVEWENTPITGQIQVTKTSADYNSVNGWPAGTPLPDVVFEIYDKVGNLVDTIQTDKNGVAKSRPLPLGRYTVKESIPAPYYGLDTTPMEVELEFSGQIVRMAMTNKSLNTNVSIKKTGYTEVMPGQSIRYDISDIGNNSNVSLTSFYWRDTLPVDAVRLDKIVTGTYNAPGNYKIVYQTNLSNGNWYTLADNLSTSQNYVLDASPAALRLASNEYVTQFMASFGVVPVNFRQVEMSQVYCTVLSTLSGGAQFVNQADVGGVYQGQWIMATSRWVTRVYKPATPSTLPRTGY